MSDMGQMIGAYLAFWLVVIVIVSAIGGWALIEGVLWLIDNIDITIGVTPNIRR